MKRINDIEEALADVRARRLAAEAKKAQAATDAASADEELAAASAAEERLASAKKKKEEADREYSEALEASGYEEGQEDKKAKQKKENKKKEKKQKEKNNVSFWKWLLSILLVIALAIGAHELIEEIQKNINKNPDDGKKPTTSMTTTEPTEPEKTQEEPMTVEKLEEIATTFTKYLQDHNINVNTEDVLKLTVIANLDRMLEECPEVVKEIMGTQTKEEFLGDAFKVIGTIMNHNFQVYETEGKTDNFIRMSQVVYGQVNAEHLQLIESYMDQIALAKNDPEKQNQLAEELITQLYSVSGKLENIEDGIGLMSVVAINDIANHVSFVNGTCQLNDQVRGTLLNYITGELYISNIFAGLEGCYGNETSYSTEPVVYYVEPESEYTATSSYTRKRTL